MKHFLSLILLFTTLAAHANFDADTRWITASNGNVDAENTWIAFRKDLSLDHIPTSVEASIAADSKYWLWINNQLVVFEGQLKRGPTPADTYYDHIDITPYLHKGDNHIAVLLWYFGKSGFSHRSSGHSGLLFCAQAIGLHSDSSWQSRIHPAYSTCPEPRPNSRLSESSIRFDGQQEMPNWQSTIPQGFSPSREIGQAGSAPWNVLVKRLTPQWKNFGPKRAKYQTKRGDAVDTLVVHLPYNMQLTPIIEVEDIEGGHEISMLTDHLFGGGEPNVWAQYITRPGKQSYESLGWMNGEWLYVRVPHSVKVKNIAYRETGYNCEQIGGFSCDDDYFNTYWQKTMRTLYVNMRDTYFDCPDRERSQWWGDGTLLMTEAFYSQSTSAHAIAKKGFLELCKHQTADYSLYSPIPGIWTGELPAQMLATVGMPGVWKYFMHTGDLALLSEVYPYIRNYLSVWSLDDTGLTNFRRIGWNWGDWGDNRDMRLIYAAWHYHTLDAAARMADVLQKPADAAHYRATMAKLKAGFNACWNGTAYRHPDYKDDTDDRVQALAVVAGLADADKYPAIRQLFRTHKHASPYMEKYVTDACFLMNDGAFGMERVRERYRKMVEHPDYTTLFEGWGIGAEGFGGGTTNHAWSGGPLITVCEHLMGVTPLEPGWRTFQVKPMPVTFNKAQLTVPTVRGMVHFAFKKSAHSTSYTLTVPAGTEALFHLPCQNPNNIKGKKDYIDHTAAPQQGHITLRLPAGKYKYTVNE